MTDLVRRLRESSAAWFAEGECSNSELEREAANRIESQMQLIGASGEAIGAMLARIEQLEAALRESYKFEETLMRISHLADQHPVFDDALKAYTRCASIARDALAGEKKDG
jgi:hypothetical protein